MQAEKMPGFPAEIAGTRSNRGKDRLYEKQESAALKRGATFKSF